MADAIFLNRSTSRIKDISAAVVTLASSSFIYDGTQKTQQVESVVLGGKTLIAGTDYTVTGNTATNAGTHTLTIFGVGKYNGAITKQWSIAKATGSISVSPTSLTISGAAGTTSTATITYTGDGSISVSSNKTSVATVSRSGTTVTVTSVATGSATITITLAAGTNYTGASCTIAVTVSIPSYNTTLANNTWEQIAEACAAGVASNYWKVGDTKTETLNGTTYTFRVVGFDHDNLHSDDAKYSDSSYNGGKKKAAITFEMTALFTTSYYMNASHTNSGGWDSSYIRKTVMKNMLGYMPTTLKNVLRTVSKLASAGNASSTIKTSADQLFLLSEIEINGMAKVSYAGEGSQYAYYKAGNSAIKMNGSSVSSWWTRSPRSSDSKNFALALSDGSVGYGSAGYSQGISFGFCI